MQNLKDQLLRAGLASKEQVQQAEVEREQQAALAKFQRTGELRDFVTAFPKWKNGFRGLPLDTPVTIYEELEHKMLRARWPSRGQTLEAGYGSPYLGTTLVVRVDRHTGEVTRTPIEPNDTGKRVSAIGDSFVSDVAIVERHENDVEIFVRLV